MVQGRSKRLAKAVLQPGGEPNCLHRLVFRQAFGAYVTALVKRNVGTADRVLDIGAGSFQFTKRLHCEELIGIDVLSEPDGDLGWGEMFLEEARSSGISMYIANAEQLPFPSSSIDKVILTEVIEHIENPGRSVAEISRCLKEHGRLILSTPNGEEVPNTNPFHLRHYQSGELRALLEEHFGKVVVWKRFPYRTLFEKQYLPGIGYLAAIVYSHLYSAFNAIFGFLLRDRGYTLFAQCDEPRSAGPDVAAEGPRVEAVCPVCKGHLSCAESEIRCAACGRLFLYHKGIPVLLSRVPYQQKRKRLAGTDGGS